MEQQKGKSEGRKSGVSIVKVAEKPRVPKTERGLSDALFELGYLVRFNLRLAEYEVRKTGGSWRTLPEQERLNIRMRIAETYNDAGTQKEKEARWDDMEMVRQLTALAAEDEVDPAVADLIMKAPDWDEKNRFIEFFPTVFGTPQDDFSSWAARFLFVGAIQRTLAPGDEIQEIPVLYGPQNVGKSTLMKDIMPEGLKGYARLGFRFESGHGSDQKNFEQVAGALIVEFGELSGLSGNTLELWKSWSTREVDTLRLPYARRSQQWPRRFVVVGTTDRADCLPNDPAGNRRFVVIPTPRRMAGAKKWIRENCWQLWAQGVAEYQKGCRANLPHVYAEAQASRNEEYREADALEEEIRAAFPEGGHENIQDVGHKVGMVLGNQLLDGIQQKRLRAALRNIGADTTTKRYGKAVKRGWLIPPSPQPQAEDGQETAPF